MRTRLEVEGEVFESWVAETTVFNSKSGRFLAVDLGGDFADVVDRFCLGTVVDSLAGWSGHGIGVEGDESGCVVAVFF